MYQEQSHSEMNTLLHRYHKNNPKFSFPLDVTMTDYFSCTVTGMSKYYFIF